MEDVIYARDLVKAFNGKEVVKGISFSVRQGECFGLLGPNGAGKSSTVKMIYCFLPVTSGILKVLGMDVQEKAREIKKKIGVVAQENNLDNELTVLGNLLVYASFFNLPKREARLKAEELLAFFGLEEYQHKKVETLSGGMKRRLTIARALIHSPEILILDEPTTGLDPQARHLVWQRLRSLKERGVTLLFTTHYMDEAVQLCDRLIIIDMGRILESGRPRDLIGRHVGETLLEIRGDPGIWDSILENGRAYIKEHMIVGDTILLYPTDGQALIQALRPVSDRFFHQTLRPATLEDVFLKLTGRGLVDEFSEA